MTPTTKEEYVRHATISHNRAEEARVVAADIKDPFHKQTMLNIAKEYEELAKYYEQRAKSV